MKQAQTLPANVLQKLQEKRSVKIDVVPDKKNAFVTGGRNDTLFKLGCSLRRQDLSYEVTRMLLHRINASLCKPQLSKKEVNAIMKSTSRYDEEASTNFSDMADVQTEEVDWYWYPYLPRGCIVFLDGHPGRGKSYFTMFLAAMCSKGGKLPFSKDRLPKGRVLILNAEDDAAKTMRPRLEKAGANLEPNRIHFEDGFKALTKQGVQVLEAKIHGFKPDLIIIDPLLTYMGSGVDSNRFNDVTEFLTGIDQLAREHNVCVIGVRHMAKSGGDFALNKGLGSIGFAARARSVLHIGVSRNDDKILGFAHVKSNWSELGKTLLFELVGGSKTEIPTLKWLSEADYGAEALDPVNAVGRPKAEPNLSELIAELLDGGAMSSSAILNALLAKGVGVSKRTVIRELELIAEQKGKGVKTVWILK
jgi:hypothetical protein